VAHKPYFPTIRDLPTSCAQQVLDSLLNLIYPETCFICSIPLARQRDCGICSSCWGKAIALKILPPRCPSCGLPLPNFESNSDHLCGNCVLTPPIFAAARAFGYYTGEFSRLIQGLKFDGRRNLAKILAPLLAEVFCETWDRSEFDLIVPIPLHPKRKRKRGYNQSELLAGFLASQIAVPLSRHALIRVRPTLPQVGLTDAQRLENVRNVFSCNDLHQISKQRILLVDDVMTTGATAISAARTLMNGGALRVSVLTLARTVSWQ
jgi:ComF family protein